MSRLKALIWMRRRLLDLPNRDEWRYIGQYIDADEWRKAIDQAVILVLEQMAEEEADHV